MSISQKLNRRTFVSGGTSAIALTLAGCSSTGQQQVPPRLAAERLRVSQQASFNNQYGAVLDEPFAIPAVDLSRVKPQFWRRPVPNTTGEVPGTVVVDTKSFHLYWIMDDGNAMRYGVGLGRAGFAWSGRARIAWKKAWPKWTPPAEMIARQPELEKWSAQNGGHPPGIDNPLGARALYIFEGNQDTLYRIHGSPEISSIGKAVSSGCVRLMNQDIIDLYNRVPNDTPIVVL